MRFASVRVGGNNHLGLIDGEHVHLFAALARRVAGSRASRTRGAPRPEFPDDMLSFIERGAITQARAALALGRRLLREGRAHGLVLPMSKVRLLAPIPRPRKNIFCLGRNYAAHAKEWGADVPKAPIFFTKPPTCVVGPGEPVVHHSVTRELDYEVELVVVIGKRGRSISAGKAMRHVFGYTIINDITARDLQRRHDQWFKGKSLDSFGPMGPWIVHRSVIRDPHVLALSMRVNGEVRQDSSTSKMLFRIPEILSVLSAGMTLEPGDLIATGTPEGVAAGMTPPRWLRPGDMLEAEIEGIGKLRNRIVAS
jgi:2-keto-4-pentenoate hydratase/2-oxohepta-3-ene-1,7-dioic acid hydratase in catechol pathway